MIWENGIRFWLEENVLKFMQPYWLILSIIDPELEKRLKKYASGRLIDIGCGDKPYQAMTAPYVSTHIGIDHRGKAHQDNSRIDYFSSAYKLPFCNQSFDSALCTDVLEHLEEPGLALAEAFRVLKTGGYAIYTVPLFWHLHEQPRDFYRYTEFGLRYLFEKSGFEVVEIKALSGFFVTFGQELVYFLWRYRKGGRRNPLWWLIPGAGMIIQRITYLLNRVDRSDIFTAEYIAVARKSP